MQRVLTLMGEVRNQINRKERQPTGIVKNIIVLSRHKGSIS
jgi:hypothetical protein